MTIEEIKRAKAEAEARIRSELRQLERATGMRFAAIDVKTALPRIGVIEETLVMGVQIDLRVP